MATLAALAATVPDERSERVVKEPGNFSVAFQEAMRQQTAGKPLVVDDRLSVYLDHCIMSRSVDALLAKEVSGGNLCSYDHLPPSLLCSTSEHEDASVDYTQCPPILKQLLDTYKVLPPKVVGSRFIAFMEEANSLAHHHSFIYYGGLEVVDYALALPVDKDADQPMAFKVALWHIMYLWGSVLEIDRRAILDYKNGAIVTSIVKVISDHKWEVLQGSVLEAIRTMAPYNRVQELLVKHRKVLTMCNIGLDDSRKLSQCVDDILLILSTSTEPSVQRALLACNISKTNKLSSVILRARCEESAWRECCEKISHRRKASVMCSKVEEASACPESPEPDIVSKQLADDTNVSTSPLPTSSPSDLQNENDMTRSSVHEELPAVKRIWKRSGKGKHKKPTPRFSRSGSTIVVERIERPHQPDGLRSEIDDYINTVTVVYNGTFQTTNFDNIARLAVDGVDEVWSRDIGMVAGLGCLPSYVCRILLVALARQYLVKTAINTPESVSVLSDWETIREHVATFASSTHSELCQATRALLSEVGEEFGPPATLQNLCIQSVSENALVPIVREQLHLLPTGLLRQLAPMHP